MCLGRLFPFLRVFVLNFECFEHLWKTCQITESINSKVYKAFYKPMHLKQRCSQSAQIDGEIKGSYPGRKTFFYVFSLYFLCRNLSTPSTWSRPFPSTIYDNVQAWQQLSQLANIAHSWTQHMPGMTGRQVFLSHINF